MRNLKIIFGSVIYFDYHWLLVSLFSLPVLLWFMVISCATMALMTKAYTVHPDEGGEAGHIIEEMDNTKQSWMMRAVCSHGELYCAISGYPSLPGGVMTFQVKPDTEPE